MKPRISLPLLLVACLGVLMAPGCANRKLDPAGPYAGDFILYQADGVIEDVDAAYDAIEGLAARNPEIFQSNQQAKELLARIKKERDGTWEADEILAGLYMARDAYKAGRGEQQHLDLKSSIGVARSFLEQARVFLAAFHR